MPFSLWVALTVALWFRAVTARPSPPFARTRELTALPNDSLSLPVAFAQGVVLIPEALPR